MLRRHKGVKKKNATLEKRKWTIKKVKGKQMTGEGENIIKLGESKGERWVKKVNPGRIKWG